MADQNAGGGKLIDDLVTKAKDVGGHVREFAEDTFDHAKGFASGAGENLKDLTSHAGENLKDFASHAGENIKDLAGTARDKGQQAFDGIKQKLSGDAVKDAATGTAHAVTDAVETAKEVSDTVYGGKAKPDAEDGKD